MQKTRRRIVIGLIAAALGIGLVAATTSTANAMGTGGHTAERVVR
ncbi:MAG TPA: hypothetical protein PL051_03310 [Candidatus Saccharibacteria bacterium]|nr:hypothetical protein [Candidatus Saccharibacteria bacterium]